MLIFLILRIFHLFVGINIYYILLLGFMVTHLHYTFLQCGNFKNYWYEELIFIFLSFCFFTFHFFYLFWGTIIYYFFLSFYLLVSTFFLSFFNLFVVATIILLLLRFMVTFLFSMMWGGFKVRESITWANAKGVLGFYGQLVM